MEVLIVNERFQLPTLWQIVRGLRATIGERFAHLEPHLVDAIKLTVSELAENIVKFAATDGDQTPIIELQASASRIRIRSENTVRSQEDAQTVLRTLERIRAHANPTALFAQAIEESLEQASGASRQGFYQIAAVGGFQLEAVVTGDRLVVVAERDT